MEAIFFALLVLAIVFAVFAMVSKNFTYLALAVIFAIVAIVLHFTPIYH
jgi:mannose/fructose/N-acetylgalactosamine-specific phosphotransferase system component IID